MWPFSPVVILTLKRKQPRVNIFTVSGVNQAFMFFKLASKNFKIII